MSGGITFYSTKRSSNVSIPPNKVCGYRIKNPMMKNGYSDGMRADRENGVVNQRLSRYATEDERKCAGSNCEGNTNWLNHRKVHFNTPESADNQFWIKRPTFKEGTVNNSYADPQLPKNMRDGLGNRDITRNNFLAPAIKARFTGDFDKLQALDISEVGKPEGITDNKLGYFTQIKVPDPNDFKWLREKARLEAEYTARFTAAGFPAGEIPAMVGRELEINKPLGRDQRTINKTSNDIANSKLNTAEKLREIIQEVRNGRADNQAGRIAVTAQLIQILADTQAINALTQGQLVGLGQALARIGIPTEHKRLGLIPRFVDNAFYLQNAGMINLLLFSKVRESPNNNQYNYDQMVKNYNAHPANGLPAIKLTRMVASLRRIGRDGNIVGDNILDLERGGVMSIDQVRALGGDMGSADYSILQQLR